MGGGIGLDIARACRQTLWRDLSHNPKIRVVAVNFRGWNAVRGSIARTIGANAANV